MEKVAFFDFCETLIDFQTADAFVHYVRNNYGTKRMRFWNGISIFLSKTYILLVMEKLLRSPLNKKLVLWQLKGFSQLSIKQYAQEYYYEMIKPHQIRKTVELLHDLQSKGYRIVLVSGGYYEYLFYFAQDNGIKTEDIISSKIEFEKGICTGKMEGVDCMGKNKIMMLEKRFNKKDLLSVSFSDSHSDLPFLRWTNDGFVISRNFQQEWAIKEKIKQIVW